MNRTNFVALVACCLLCPVSLARAGYISPTTWATATAGDASASVVTSSNVDLRVFQTSWAAATTDLGPIDGNVNVSFDYTIVSQGWWEVPLVSLSTASMGSFQIPGCDDHTGLATSSCGDILAVAPTSISIAPYATTVGQFSGSVTEHGDVNLAIALVPSKYSSNGDHYNTYFNVTNLTIQAQTVPEPASLPLAIAGLCGVAAIRRRGAKG